jgi:succinate dehydrogenase flavin-adding protein (antitoxin of CptAB toxin-antitoxin module)
MALSGSLREFALSEILQLLSSQRKTGCLRLTRGADMRVVYLLEGRIASMRDRGYGEDDPLGRFLRRVHRLSEEQLRGIASIHAESNRDLVDLLLNGRYIDREELAMLYERMVLDVLHDILSWDDGAYSFSNVSPPESALQVSLSTESMLMEAVRRSDELRRYRQKLTDPSLVLGLKELPDPDTSLGEDEKELFGIVDGRRTLGELIAEAPFTDFEAYEALFRLIEAGWIEIQGRRAPEHVVEDAAPARPGFGATWRTEATLAGACTFLVLVMQLLSWKTTAPAHPSRDPGANVYAALGLRDVRAALEAERVRSGQYPASLSALVDAGWLQANQLKPAGATLSYANTPGDNTYTLEFSAPTR